MNTTFAEWYEKNAHRFEAYDPEINEARHVLNWECEDGWIVGYTTTRVVRGKDVGKSVVFAYKPTGKGARGGRGSAERHEMVYERPFSTRAAAKKRAIDLYRKHSPKWDEKHRRVTS